MKQRRDIIFILGASLALVLLWVVFSIYHNLNASTISEPVSVDINPIQPNFQENVITSLKKRQKVEPLLSTQSPSPSPSTSPLPTTTPAPSSLTGNNSSSQSSQISP